MNTRSVHDLPAYLSPPVHILIDPEVLYTQVTRRVLSRLPGVPWSLSTDQRFGPRAEASANRPELQSSFILYLKHYKGRFLRFCPGTRNYHCCAYRIMHIGENCPLNCSYCILKAYFQDRIIKVWANQEDLFRELELKLRPESSLFRAGTGEFTDSLALEPLTGYTGDLVQFLGNYPNVCLELKSKIIDLSWIKKVSDPSRVLPAWSVNSPEIIKTQEQGSAGLEDRMRAAAFCAAQGFRVCLHFDPIIHYPGWEKGYALAVETIFDYLKPEVIAYLSLGSFRFMPELENIIMRNEPRAKYIYNEFITGLDGKKRLLLPLRLEQFSFIAGHLKDKGLLDRQMYFCMESSYIWTKVLGYTPEALGGLDKHLLRLSFVR